MRILTVLTAALALALPATASALDTEPMPLRGRHLVAFNVGVLTDVTSGATVDVVDNVSIDAQGSGVLASMRYCYWFREAFALDFAVGIMDADASVTVDAGDVLEQAAFVTRVLVGVRYEPPTMAVARNIRPYAVGAIGSCSGNVGELRTGATSTRIAAYNDTVFSGRVGLGLDFLLHSWVALGIEAGYGFTGDFDRPIGGQTDYSSADFLVSLGVSLGGAR